MHFKKRTEVRPASSSHSITMGKLIHLPYFLFFFSAGMLEEKEEAMQKDGERIQELEQTLFEHRCRKACPLSQDSSHDCRVPRGREQQGEAVRTSGSARVVLWNGVL